MSNYLPAGGLFSFGSYAFPAHVSGAPILQPALKRSYGKALNGPYPINRDAAQARFDALKLTWKFLALPASGASSPYDSLAQVLADLYAAMYLTGQVGTLIAYQGTISAGTLVSCQAAIDMMPYQLGPTNSRHYVAEITFQVLSAFGLYTPPG